jgi:hypothetical protein
MSSEYQKQFVNALLGACFYRSGSVCDLSFSKDNVYMLQGLCFPKDCYIGGSL